MQQPTRLISTPFAQEGEKTDIQNVTGESDNSATYRVGFPPITMQSIRLGGKPPKGMDFNGVLFDITENISFLCKGGRYQYSAGLSTLIGGYPEGSNLLLDDNITEVVSEIASNQNNPNTNMTGWKLKPTKASSVLSDGNQNQQEINDFGGAKWYAKVGGYELGATVKLDNGDIVKSTKPANTVNPNVDMTGWVKSLEPYNSILSKNISQNTSIHSIVEALANSLNDGDTLLIPSGTYYWDGQAVITKQINIECNGTINAKYRAGGDAHLLFRSPVALTYAASDLFIEMKQGATKLPLKATFTGDPTSYFMVVTSTEIATKRPNFGENYTKNIVLDIVKNDFTLRDPLPFSFLDLTKATVRLVKKRIPVTHRGLKFNTTGTDSLSEKSNSIGYMYSSNINTVDSLQDLGLGSSVGSSYSFSYSYNLNFNNSYSVLRKETTSSVATYNFLYWICSYCSLNNCGNETISTNFGTSSGVAGRHGFKIKVDNCLFGSVDDHWGYDLTVTNSNIERGVSMAGGSLTIDNCSGDVIFRQRVDPPYNDGVLTITNCNKWRSNLITMLGHDNPTWVSKDYASRKCFNVINIDNCGAIASNLPLDRTELSPKMILMRDPQLDEVNVYRDTILNIDSVSLINDVSGLDPIQLIDCFNESEDKIYLNYDKKRMFSSINLTNVKSLFLNGANTWRVGVVPVCDILNIGEGCQNIEFSRMRARKINISNGIIANVGTGTRVFDCETLTISGMDLSQLTSSLAYIAKSNRYYQNTDVYIYNSKLPSQLYVWNAFTNPATAGVEGINLKIGLGNSIANYDMGGYADPFIPDARNYNSDLIVRYATPSPITLAAGGESAIYQLSFPQVKAADSVVGRFDIQQGISVTVVAPTSYDTGRNRVYYRLKNTSTESITIPSGAFLTFRIV